MKNALNIFRKTPSDSLTNTEYISEKSIVFRTFMEKDPLEKTLKQFPDLLVVIQTITELYVSFNLFASGKIIN